MKTHRSAFAVSSLCTTIEPMLPTCRAVAVKTYQSAYADVRRVSPEASPTPLQAWGELTAVAELIHLKVLLILQKGLLLLTLSTLQSVKA